MKQLPNELRELKGLKYLNLVGCLSLKSLPDSVSKLTNLNSLKIGGCEMVVKEPENICKLQALTHLHIVNLAELFPLLSCLHEFQKLGRLTM